MRCLSPSCYLKRFWSGVLVVALCPGLLSANTEITPTLLLSESFVENSTVTLDESGQITRVSPGIGLTYQQARLDLSLNYQYNSLNYHNLAANDTDTQNLNLLARIVHDPKSWNTRIFSEIRQINVSADGIQIVNPLLDSDNTQELRTLGLATQYQSQVGESINFNSELSLDAAETDEQDRVDSAGLLLEIDNHRAHGPLAWNASLSSRKFDRQTSPAASNPATEQQIDALNAGMDYRLNRNWALFLTVESNETDNDNLDGTQTLVGVQWNPSVRSFIRLGAGMRDDEETWTLDSKLRNRRMTLSAHYSERVTTQRGRIVEIGDVNNPLTQLGPTDESLAITPVLVKRFDLAVITQGVRSILQLGVFREEENIRDTDTKEERTDGARFTASRTLSRLSTLSFGLLRQKTRTTQQNRLTDVSLSYNRQVAKRSQFTVDLSHTRQESSIAANESEQDILTLSYQVTF